MRLISVWFANYFAQFLDNFWLQNLWVNLRAPRDLTRKKSRHDQLPKHQNLITDAVAIDPFNNFTTLYPLSLLNAAWNFWLKLDRFYKIDLFTYCVFLSICLQSQLVVIWQERAEKKKVESFSNLVALSSDEKRS